LKNITAKQNLKNIQCFLLDMDGTIYLEDYLLPGASAFINHLEDSRIDYLFLTNNSSKDAAQYIDKLAGFGISVSRSRIMTSGDATAIYLKKNHPQASLYVVGTEALQQAFISDGFTISDTNPDIIVLGFDTTLTYEKLWKSCNFIREGRKYIATHPDINCPTRDGFMPDIGSFIALIQASTGREPDVIIGKPFEPMIEAIESHTGYTRNEICMIGDRLYTDIAMGEYGIFTILVLSGEAKEGDIANARVQPDIVFEDIGKALEYLK